MFTDDVLPILRWLQANWEAIGGTAAAGLFLHFLTRHRDREKMRGDFAREKHRIEAENEREQNRLRAERSKMLFDKRAEVFGRFQVKTEEMIDIIQRHGRGEDGDKYADAATADHDLEKALEEARRIAEQAGIVSPRVREGTKEYLELFQILLFLTAGDPAVPPHGQRRWSELRAEGLDEGFGKDLYHARNVVRDGLHRILSGQLED